MKINLTTQTIVLTITDEDLLEQDGYLYKYFYAKLKAELEKNPTANIKTLAYKEANSELVLLIFNKDGFTQKKIHLEDVEM